MGHVEMFTKVFICFLKTGLIFRDLRIHFFPKVVIVFSTHGFNRTGLLIVSYLVRVASSNLIDALKTFEKSRQDIGIYRVGIGNVPSKQKRVFKISHESSRTRMEHKHKIC